MSAPQLPRPGYDADRLLVELQRCYPHTSWDLNWRLQITAHSRAADLRNLGWDVESVRERSTSSDKGARFGYRLLTPREMWPPRDMLVETLELDAIGQVRIA